MLITSTRKSAPDGVSHQFSRAYMRGFHIYGEHWTAFVGGEITCQRKRGNVIDRYAVTVEKATDIRVLQAYPIQLAHVANKHAASFLFT